jgi:hypothetical protein
MNVAGSLLNYLFAGIPIFNALRFIINMNATKLSEIIAPTRNIASNTILFHAIITIKPQQSSSHMLSLLKQEITF